MAKAVAIALTVAAGFVDCFGYVMLGRVFTAMMSGNTVLIGVFVGAEEWATALLYVHTVAMFTIGLVVAGAVLRVAERLGLVHILALAMALEALCLAAVLVIGARVVPAGIDAVAPPSELLLLLVALAAMAMGVQNTSLRMAGVLTVYTTHITGSLTRFGEAAVDAMLPPRPGPTRRAALSTAIFQFGLWAGFLTGAVLSAYAARRLGFEALLIPIAIVAAIGAIDSVRPLRSTAGATN
jgi:uncharacterized membrane protein YoaK (UPF0700 family)